MNCISCKFKRSGFLPSQEEGGRVPFVDLLFRMPWGFRAVTDLSDYTITELADLIEKASALLKQKIEAEGATSVPPQ